MVVETLFNWQKDFVNAPLEVSKDAGEDRPREGAGWAICRSRSRRRPNILPAVSRTGYRGLGTSIASRGIAKAPEYQIAQNWTWTRGSHIFKCGRRSTFSTRRKRSTRRTRRARSISAANSASAFRHGLRPGERADRGAFNSFTQVSNSAHKFSMYQDFHFFVAGHVEGDAQSDARLRPAAVPHPDGVQHAAGRDSGRGVRAGVVGSGEGAAVLCAGSGEHGAR